MSLREDPSVVVIKSEKVCSSLKYTYIPNEFYAIFRTPFMLTAVFSYCCIVHNCYLYLRQIQFN